MSTRQRRDRVTTTKSEDKKSIKNIFKKKDNLSVDTEKKSAKHNIKAVKTEAKPKAENKKSVITDIKPVVTEVKPVVTEVKPIVTEVKPVVTEVKPIVTEVKPVVTEVKPIITEVKPVVTEVKPIITEVKPTVTEVKPVDSEDDDSEEPAETDEKKTSESAEDDIELDNKKIEELLAKKEARKQEKKEKRLARKRKVKSFFSNGKEFVIDVFTGEYDLRELASEQIEKLRDIRFEIGERVESDEMLDMNARLQIEKNKNRIRIVSLSVLVIISIVSFAIYNQVRVFHNYKVISSVERTDNDATEYVTFGSRTLKCNPNGVTCFNRKGEVQWNTTFTMNCPIVETCGKLVAVADQRGSEVYVFDANGLVGNFPVEHIIKKMKLTQKGDVALVMEDGQVTWINVYDKVGNILIKKKTTMAESGYPVDMDISVNGYKMMVSFLGVGDDIETHVVFYNFSAVGQDKEGKVVSEDVYTSHVVPEVKFMEGNYALAFRDDGATVYRGQQIPEEWNDITIDSEIISVFSDDKYFGFVTNNEDTEKNEGKYQMMIYRENGTKCGTAYFSYEYTGIVLGENRIVLYNSHSVRIYDVSGKLKYDAEYPKQIQRIVPTGNAKKYNIITNESEDLIRIK